MNTPDHHCLSHRRRAAMAVLSSHLPADSLRDALDLLQQEYASSSASSVIGFVNAVAARFGIDPAERKGLYTELFRLLHSVNEQDLPADPWSPANSGNAASRRQDDLSTAPPGVTPWQPAYRSSAHLNRDAEIVFRALVKGMQAGFGERTTFAEQRDYQVALDSSIEQMTALGATRRVLRQWLRSSDSSLPAVPFEVDVMSAVVHAVYLSSCLVIGRGETDKVLDSALEKVRRRVPEAEAFPPERLL